jgi:hypothetical protein
MSQNSSTQENIALTDGEKNQIIIKAIEIVNRNHNNFKSNVRSRENKISSSNLRNILNSTTGLPLEFYVFCQYLAGKNNRTSNLVNFLRDLIKTTKNLIREMVPSKKNERYLDKKRNIITYFIQNIVMSAKYCESFGTKLSI